MINALIILGIISVFSAILVLGMISVTAPNEEDRKIEDIQEMKYLQKWLLQKNR